MIGVDLSDTTIEHLVAQAVESISERVTEQVLTRITEAMKPQKEDETISLLGLDQNGKNGEIKTSREGNNEIRI